MASDLRVVLPQSDFDIPEAIAGLKSFAAFYVTKLFILLSD
jgi:hypothetical protein